MTKYTIEDTNARRSAAAYAMIAIPTVSTIFLFLFVQELTFVLMQTIQLPNR